MPQENAQGYPKLDLEAEKAGKAMTWEQLYELGTKLTKGPKDAREVYGFYPVTTNSQAVVNGIRSFGGWELDDAFFIYAKGALDEILMRPVA